MYFPAISYLRGVVIPESNRANVMNWFRLNINDFYKHAQCFNPRVPMNVITCGALLCLHVDAISKDKRIVFAACFVFAVTGRERLMKTSNFWISKPATPFLRENTTQLL
jgi:hypothetical protein